MEVLKRRSTWAWTIRIAVSAMFVVSGLAKLFPITPFEKQLFDLLGGSFCTAQYLARLIVALEFAIAVGILQRHFLKRFVLPVTGLLLVAFCVHLGWDMYQHGGLDGNCGCFGQWIPMTPLEALIKNLVTLGLLGGLWFLVEEDRSKPHNFGYILLIYTAIGMATFAYRPFCPCESAAELPVTVPAMTTTESTPEALPDSTGNVPVSTSTSTAPPPISISNSISSSTSTRPRRRHLAVRGLREFAGFGEEDCVHVRARLRPLQGDRGGAVPDGKADEPATCAHPVPRRGRRGDSVVFRGGRVRDELPGARARAVLLAAGERQRHAGGVLPLERQRRGVV